METMVSDLTQGHQVEVAQVSVSDEGAPASRSAHGGHKLHICHGSEAVVPPIPATHVHELPKELNWRLHITTSFLYTAERAESKWTLYIAVTWCKGGGTGMRLKPWPPVS